MLHDCWALSKVINNNMIGALFRFENDSHHGHYLPLIAILECLVIRMTRDVNQLIYSRVNIIKPLQTLVPMNVMSGLAQDTGSAYRRGIHKTMVKGAGDECRQANQLQKTA